MHLTFLREQLRSILVRIETEDAGRRVSRGKLGSDLEIAVDSVVIIRSQPSYTAKIPIPEGSFLFYQLLPFQGRALNTRLFPANPEIQEHRGFSKHPMAWRLIDLFERALSRPPYHGSMLIVHTDLNLSAALVLEFPMHFQSLQVHNIGVHPPSQW